ncbi:MAG: hypothetical protein JXA53_00660 [Bacteroidales bacterium]|nr:hypothetical protein [Bacteroidales bacterium]
MEVKQFVETIFIKEIGRLQKEEFFLFSFILIGQGIESLGAIIDTKPLKAKAQSRKRFDDAIYKLFPREYQKLNLKGMLYDQLRSALTHLFIPGGFLTLATKADKELGDKHLQIVNGATVIVAENLYSDFVYACNRLFDGIEKGKVKRTKLNVDLPEGQLFAKLF